MQLDDADAGDAGKEKDARPPCGMTRGDSDRRQCEKDGDAVLGTPAAFRGGADDADALLGAALPPAPAEAAADGDAGHHVARDAEARKVTRDRDRDAAAGTSSGATALPRLPLLGFTAGGGGDGCFLERLGRRKHVHLRTPPPAAGSVAPFATLGRCGGGGRALLVCRGCGCGARGTFSLAEAIILVVLHTVGLTEGARRVVLTSLARLI
jgi:hypothetical protein